MTSTSPAPVSTIRQRNSTVHLRADGIFEVEVDAGAEVNLDDPNESVKG